MSNYLPQLPTQDFPPQANKSNRSSPASKAVQSPFTHFSRKDVVIALLVILFAFTYRCGIIWDRANAPGNSGAFNPLPAGSDQGTYYLSILDFQN